METKSGARHSKEDMAVLGSVYAKAGEIQKHMKELGHMEKLPLAEDLYGKTDTLIMSGSEVKALGDGKVGGYLVRFSDETEPDLAGDFFASDTDFGEAKSSPILFHHGLDAKIGNRKLGSVSFKTDDVGIWVEGLLEMRDKYEKAVYDLARKGKLGWSSGTANHLVRRKKVGEAQKIEAWPLGLDASLTPTPAEPRNHAIELKAIKSTNIEIPEDVTEGTENPVTSVVDAKTNNNQKGITMTPEEKAAIVAETKAALTAEAQASEVKRLAEEAQVSAIKAAAEAAVKEALKTAPAVNGGGLKGGAPAALKNERGDDAFKSMAYFLRTGDGQPLRTGEQYDAMKTTYALVEATQYQGQEAVPTEVLAKIHTRRNVFSIARNAGVQVQTVGSNAVVYPIEKNGPEKFVIAAENNTYDQLTQQPMDKLSATIYNFTKWVPIGNQLREDSTFGIVDWWIERQARAMAETENYYFVSVGTGSSQPGSALVGSTLGVTAASQTVVTAGEIVSLYHSLPAEYRDNAVWVLTGTKEGLVRGLTASTSFPFTGNGGYAGGVGNVSVAQGAGWLVAPNTKVYNDANMPASTTGLKTILFGNFSAGYVIFERQAMQVFVDPYSGATSGLTKIISTFREGGGVVDATALYHLIQA